MQLNRSGTGVKANLSNWPELTFPEAETTLLRDTYEQASVILEYGSGGSTVLAAKMLGKLVFSVESDRAWALRLQVRIDEAELPSPATVYHVDIGPTGAWGRPLDQAHWPKFHNYPVAIWDEPFFRHPDVVLIDGRFRVACMMTVMVRAKRPITVLFDDYAEREPYHIVEEKLTPREIVGRMAVFDVTPGLITAEDLGAISQAFSFATYAGGPSYYNVTADKVMALRQHSQKGHKDDDKA